MPLLKMLGTVIILLLIPSLLASLSYIQLSFYTEQNSANPVVSIDSQRMFHQNVGDTRTFWEYNFDENTHYQLNAQLLAIGEQCYIYMQDTVITVLGEDEANNRCERYKDEFDATIYPFVTDLTGNPDGLIGDIDNDPRIVILISENTACYYSQYNEIEHIYSNYCEMVYIYYNTFEILGTIAHEFCHLIWFNYEFDEVHFLLEGLAEYATYYAGYFTQYNNLSSRTGYFINHTDDSLVYFDVDPKDYGGAYLFIFYLADRFGSEILKDLVQEEVDGAEGVETTLQKSGYNISFNSLYLDWITAMILDNTEIDDGQYGYHEIEIPNIMVQQVSEVDLIDEVKSLNYYGFHVYQITNATNSFDIDIIGSNSRFFGLSVAIHDANGWRVLQCQNQSSIHQNIIGSTIDTAFAIISYMNSDAPSGNIDFGSGPSTEIEVSIHSTTSMPSETTTNYSYWIFGVIALGSIPFVVSVFVLRHRKEGRLSLIVQCGQFSP